MTRGAPQSAVRQAVDLWGLGGVPRPRGRALLVEPVVLALVCCALTRVALSVLPGSAGSSAGDPRFAAAAAAGPLGTVVFCLLGPGLTEELVFRGPVVVAARLGVPRRWLAPLIVASSGAFGASHLTYSLVNAVATATWGAVPAEWAACRCSLWPVVLAVATRHVVDRRYGVSA